MPALKGFTLPLLLLGLSFCSFCGLILSFIAVTGLFNFSKLFVFLLSFLFVSSREVWTSKPEKWKFRIFFQCAYYLSMLRVLFVCFLDWNAQSFEEHDAIDSNSYDPLRRGVSLGQTIFRDLLELYGSSSALTLGISRELGYILR